MYERGPEYLVKRVVAWEFIRLIYCARFPYIINNNIYALEGRLRVGAGLGVKFMQTQS